MPRDYVDVDMHTYRPLKRIGSVDWAKEDYKEI